MSELKLQVYKIDVERQSVVLIDLNGSCTQISSQPLVKLIQDNVNQQTRFIILQMQDLSLIDSSGMEALVRLADENQNDVVHFFMVHLHSKVETIFRSLGIDTLFHVCKDQMAAFHKIKRIVAPDAVTDKLSQPMPSPHDEEFISSVAEQIAQNKFTLPTLPDLAIKLSELTSSPKTTIADLEKLLTTDPSLAAQVLNIANSVLYSGRFPVDSLKNALMRLGMRKVKSAVLAISMRTTILKGKDIDILARKLWRHSIACAILSEDLAKKLKIGNQDQLFIVSLLHDIHKVAILGCCREVIRRTPGYFPNSEILKLVYRQHRQPILAKVAVKWKLPTSIAEFLADFANPELSQPLALVSFSNKLINIVEKSDLRSELAVEREMLGIEQDENYWHDYARELYAKTTQSWNV